MLRKLLKAALDRSIIEFVVESASDKDLGANHIRVFQDGLPSSGLTQQPSIGGYHPLVSPSESRAVAIVDRSAHLQKAASALVAARFSFGGRSPYAPDLVLVNEFVKNEFVVAVISETLKFTARLGIANAVDVNKIKNVEKSLDAGLKSGKIHVVNSNSNASVFEVKDRDAESLRIKITGSKLLIHSVRSLDDAIDLANEYEQIDCAV